MLKPIMLIEDDSVDAMTVRRAMRELHINNSMVHCLDGEDGLKYLTDPETEKPFVILLDLNMPKMSGIEFLKAVKTYPELKRIPIVVLTTSKEKRDVLDSFELGAAGYMIKPVDYAKFTDVINTVMLYWSLSELPRQKLKLADAKQ
ncbi:MAG: response regulator [Planctomycetota bacterium]